MGFKRGGTVYIFVCCCSTMPVIIILNGNRQVCTLSQAERLVARCCTSPRKAGCWVAGCLQMDGNRATNSAVHRVRVRVRVRVRPMQLQVEILSCTTSTI